MTAYTFGTFIQNEEVDVDVYDNEDYYNGIAVCCPVRMTEQGKKEWADVLRMPLSEISASILIVNVSRRTEKQESKRARRLRDFLLATAGYVSDKKYMEWFIE